MVLLNIVYKAIYSYVQSYTQFCTELYTQLCTELYTVMYKAKYTDTSESAITAKSVILDREGGSTNALYVISTLAFL